MKSVSLIIPFFNELDEIKKILDGQSLIGHFYLMRY